MRHLLLVPVVLFTLAGCGNKGALYLPEPEAQSAPVRSILGEAASASGFQVERTMVEAEGICPTCAQKADA